MKKGFIKLSRDELVEEILQERATAFSLLTLIARRARRGQSKLNNGLKEGECYIGDYKAYGVTRQVYRSDLQYLCTNQLATIQTTNKGTVAKLYNDAVYCINEESKVTTKKTPSQPDSNLPATTKEEVRSKKKNKYIEKFMIFSESVEEALTGYKEMRIKKSNKMTEYAEYLLRNKLYKLSEKEENQIQMVNNAIVGGWASVYELKEEDKKKSTSVNTWT